MDAASAPLAGGKLHGTSVAKDQSDFSGYGYVTGLVQQEFGVSVLAQVGPEREYEVVIRYRNSEEEFNGRVLYGRHLFYDGNQNQTYEQYINRGTVFANTNGEWKDIVIGRIKAKPGEYEVRLSASHNLPAGRKAIDVDCFKFIAL